MPQSKQAGVIRLRVPRQNAQRLGPAVTAEVYKIARDQGISAQLPPPVQEQPNASNSSSENASEWNSLLAAARAERGPQWDVGTQQFLVEKDSELYYDPTPLLQAARAAAAEAEEANNPSQQHHHQHPGQHHELMSVQMQNQYRNSYPNQQQQQYASQYGNAMGGTPMSQRSMQYPNTPYGSAIPPNSFYGDVGTPTRNGMMMDTTPQRRITRGMTEEFPGMYGN